MLQPGQTAHDRPEIANRVFKKKLDRLIEIIDKGVFYKIKAPCHWVERQKQGLTHGHLIIFFELPPDFEFPPQFINNMISADLPPPGSACHDIIEKLNIHGPWGTHNPEATCMVNGQCTKNFPKAFQVTEMGREFDAFIVYKRRSPQHGG